MREYSLFGVEPATNLNLMTEMMKMFGVGSFEVRSSVRRNTLECGV